MGKIHSLYQRF